MPPMLTPVAPLRVSRVVVVLDVVIRQPRRRARAERRPETDERKAHVGGPVCIAVPAHVVARRVPATRSSTPASDTRMSDSVPAPRPVIDGGIGADVLRLEARASGVVRIASGDRDARATSTGSGAVGVARDHGLVPASLRQAIWPFGDRPVSRYAVAIQLPLLRRHVRRGRSRRRWTRSGRPLVIRQA